MSRLTRLFYAVTFLYNQRYQDVTDHENYEPEMSNDGPSKRHNKPDFRINGASIRHKIPSINHRKR